jgi:hypothetical protein
VVGGEGEVRREDSDDGVESDVEGVGDLSRYEASLVRVKTRAATRERTSKQVRWEPLF